MFIPSGVSRVSTNNDMMESIVNMPDGSRLCYHRGFLSEARMKSKSVDAIATAMLRAGCPAEFPLGEGIVIDGLSLGHLTQKRLGSFCYEYWFTRQKGS